MRLAGDFSPNFSFFICERGIIHPLLGVVLHMDEVLSKLESVYVYFGLLLPYPAPMLWKRLGGSGRLGGGGGGTAALSIVYVYILLHPTC